MSILNDVLDHSKIEAGKLQPERARRCRCTPTAASVVALFRANAEAKGLALVLDIEPGRRRPRARRRAAPQAGAAEPGRQRDQVHRARRRVAAPAAAAAPRRPARACASRSSTAASACRARRWSAVPALPPGRRLAQPARRRHRPGPGDQPAHRRGDGRPHRGARASPARGSRFHFDARAASSTRTRPAATSIDSAMAPLDALPSRLSGTVLVVEDNPVNRIIAEEMLRVARPGRASRRRTACEALDVLARRPVDLVLMDCQMPVMDGYTATQHIRDRERAQRPAAHADRRADRQRLRRGRRARAARWAWTPTWPSPTRATSCATMLSHWL